MTTLAETATTRPQPRSTMPGRTALATWSVDQTCWLSIDRRSSSVNDSIRPPARVAADKVQQHVDAPELRDDLVDRSRGLLAIGDVADARRPAIVGEAGLCRDIGQSTAVPADQPEPSSGFGERLDDDGAKRAGCAGHQDNAIREAHCHRLRPTGIAGCGRARPRSHCNARQDASPGMLDARRSLPRLGVGSP